MRKKILSILFLLLTTAVCLMVWNNDKDTAFAAAANPTLPLSYVDSTYPTLPTGHSIRNVKISCAGQTLCYTDPQSAVNASAPGDEVVLQAGATFTGTLTLPVKSCNFSNQNQCWIIIRTSNLASLPVAGNRVSPNDAANMAKIVAPGNGSSALVAAAGSSYYRIVGIEFAKIDPSVTTYELLTLGNNDSTQTTLSSVPSHIVLDRIYAHGDPTSDLKRGVGLNSSWSAVVDSYISDIHVVGQDAQAIASFNTPGPLKIVNNYLEASTENTIFGGADPMIPNVVPSDIEVRNNYMYKPRSWRVGDPTYAGYHWAVKNIFELKNAQRVLVDGNIFDGNWLDGQDGFAIVFTPRNQDGNCPWCVVQDVTFTDNIVRHTASAFNVAGTDNGYSSQNASRILIHNNLLDDINTSWGGSGDLYQLVGVYPNRLDSLIIDHNTGFQNGSALVLADYTTATSSFQTMNNISFTNNIAAHNDYGVFGGNAGIGKPGILAYIPTGGVFTKNVMDFNIAGAASAGQYPAASLFPDTSGSSFIFLTDWSQAQFVNQAAGDYHLASTSPFKNAGSDGKDIGADITAINAATATVISGNNSNVNPTPSPTPTPTPPPSDTIPPVVVSFDVQPINTTGNVTASFSVTDSGGSYLKQIELWRAPFAAIGCNDTDKSTCTWSETNIGTAPSNSNSWTSQIGDTVPTGIYYYGIHALDNSLNIGHESSLVKITSSLITYQRNISVASLDGRTSKVLTGTVDVLSNPSKALIKSYPFVTDSTGTATIIFDIPLQSVYIKIRAVPFLSRLVSADLNSNTTYSFPNLLTGDINQDGIVNSLDFSVLNSHWFTSDASSDLNQDGLVNSLDFSLLNKNWFATGEQ